MQVFGINVGFQQGRTMQVCGIMQVGNSRIMQVFGVMQVVQSGIRELCRFLELCWSPVGHSRIMQVFGIIQFVQQGTRIMQVYGIMQVIQQVLELMQVSKNLHNSGIRELCRCLELCRFFSRDFVSYVGFWNYVGFQSGTHELRRFLELYSFSSRKFANSLLRSLRNSKNLHNARIPEWKTYIIPRTYIPDWKPA